MLSSEQLLKQYSVRVSGRAKYMRLSVSLEKGVVVVVPESMNSRRMAKLIPQFVQDKQLWLSEAIEKLQAREQHRPDIEECQLPETICLHALGHVFSIVYNSLSEIEDCLSGAEGSLLKAEGSLLKAEGSLSKAEGSLLKAEGSLLKAEGSLLKAEGSLLKAEGSLTLRQPDDYQLEIRGDLRNKKRVFALLELFFKDYARFYLKQRLDQLSKEVNLPYNRLTIRAQKTRWGSCSSKKNINLNYRLLFIEQKLLDYILLHELVHTVHMNHSKAFWMFLETLMHDARSRDKQVNQAAKGLPCWIFHK